ncbi:MAG: chemotaxis protein CheW [Planctomycetota bacterium]|nr:chemotaxis protein CheW [Planctomycetota bacterium]
MLALVFCLGDERYALECSQVVEVAPLVPLRKLAQAPPYVAGVFVYRGKPVPVLDLCQMTLGRPCRMLMSTRVILVKYPAPSVGAPPGGRPAGEQQVLGLLAERVTETTQCEPAAFAPAGVKADAAPYLGGLAPDGQGLMQSVQLEKLLPEDVRALLFQATD